MTLVRILAVLLILPAVVLVAQDDTDPREFARENSETAARALADCKKGLDEDGERVWKMDAVDFFDLKKHPRHRTFELDPKWGAEFVKKALAAGTTSAWVVNIRRVDLPGGTVDLADEIVLALPDDPAKRKAVFALHAEEVGADWDGNELTDVGQPYIHIEGD